MECTRDLRVLMLPWLAHGHLSPFLELGKRLSGRGFRVYLCSTPANLAPFRTEDRGGVELVELHLPDLPELPAHLHTTKNLPPHLMSDLKNAFDLAEPSFCDRLDSIRPSLVVYDLLHPWVADAAARRQIPAVLFLAFSCAALSFLTHIVAKPEEEFPFRSMRLDDQEVARLHRWIAPAPDRLSDGDRFTRCSERSLDFVLVKTCREIEGKYVDYMSLLRKKEHVPVGPLVREPGHLQLENNSQWSRFSAWLDDKPPSSVAFVSFGSEFFMTKEEMLEIARGLELSGVSFIWVIRFPKGEEVPREDVLPEGFLERNSEKGMVVEGWAPQDGILTHAAVGAFVTHCGWGSVLEALQWGVPMVIMPQHREHPLNGKLVAELGAGVEVRPHISGDGERSYRGEELAHALRSAMSGERSEELKRRTREMAELLRGKGDAEMDAAAARLAGLINAGAPERPVFLPLRSCIDPIVLLECIDQDPNTAPFNEDGS